MELNQIIQGDSLEVLKTLPDESIDYMITSPPYYSLRDYGVEGQIGLEKTYEEYIKKLIDIFNEAKRVLKKEGTCFVNLGDTYKSLGATRHLGWKDPKSKARGLDVLEPSGMPQGKLQEKSLMMIPERFAIAMIDNGWILRNKLVWIKKNAMPESVQDRWKKAHEYIFFFVKSKKYYFDLDSIRTKHKEVSIKRAEYELGRNAMGLNPSSMGEKYKKDKSAKYGMPARQVKLNPKGAVPPDFLDINTNCKQDETVEHYATYPMDLINPLIKAGCPKGGVVLDMFSGSGTTCVVAKRLSRNYIGIELNENYIKIAEQRLRQSILL